MTAFWIVVSIVAVFGLVAFVLFAVADCPSVEETRRAEMDAIRARAVRTNYELDRASFAQRRAIADAIQKAQRDHHH